ncbi:HNH endonuclease domain-containing protein [Altibacter sp. HG106]|uniref:HNH endonuclease domain-containing protein n=1 Tax=Altibacter sp. HG106 TaxID=3023937 RepID=UPI002350F8F6|nr:HNH endonuclease domain-containing protein [Altibacter sp. HG106]MDC7994028.1 HNH endonuclease domain-containing protein [Altibacter sp. HG106]
MHLNIHDEKFSKISSVFNNTSATYKFYWFWSILESVENGTKTIGKKELFAKMLALSWYTVNYFHISFGKQDLIQNAIYSVREIENLPIDTRQNKILNTLINSNNKSTVSTLLHFDNNVPHKFLSPWLGTGSKKIVYELSLDKSKNAPYSLFKDNIIIDDDWFIFFQLNLGVLKSFCYWHLSLFLQSRNPSVPEIPNKIQRPIIRGNLTNHKRKYWDIVLNELGYIKCIYTQKELIVGEYIIEHFIPHQFVAHDLMWNLIPAESSFNSTKSAKLPSFDKYFDDFYALQKEGFEIVQKSKPKNKFLQDYLTIFPLLNFDRSRFEEFIQPMLTIAHNNGFEYL